MKNIFIPFLLILFLASCNICQTNENITPLWSDGILTAECINATYIAEVHFDESDVTLSFSEPDFLSNTVFKINEGSINLLKDDISLRYDNEEIKGFISEFYKAYTTINSLSPKYTSEGEVCIAEFISDNKKCKVIIEKNTKKVVSCETSDCIYSFTKR